MASFVLYLLLYLIEMFIFFQYCNSIFKKSRSHLVSLSFFLGVYLLLFFISRLQFAFLNMAGFFLLNAFLLFIVYRLSVSTAFLHAAIATALMSLSELVVVTAASLFINAFEYVRTLSSMQSVIMMSVLSKLFYFLLLQAISMLLGKKGGTSQTSPVISLHFMIIPLITCFIMVTFSMIGLTNTLLGITEWMMTLSTFLLLLLNIISVALYGYYQNKQRQFAETQILLQMEHDRSEYYKLLQHESESRSILIHDIKKHLQSLSYLSHGDDQHAVRQYIDNLSESFDLNQSIRFSDSNLLNAMLLRFQKQCNDAQVSFVTDIRHGALDFLSDEHLTSLFGNLLDNALESAVSSPNAFIECNAASQVETPYTIITMKNSCESKPPTTEDGTLLSIKSTPGLHGFGIKSIIRVVEKYDGSTKLYYDNDNKVFHTILLLRKPPSDTLA